MRAASDPGLSPRHPALRLALFYAGYFLVGGVLLPFWPLLLDARGMTPLQISLLMALALWLRAAAGPLVTRHADLSGDSRPPLLACAAAALAVMLVFYWADGFWLLLLANIAFFFAYSSIGPLAETIALRTVSADAGYGRVRLWGSVAFVAAAIAGGFALDAQGGLPAATIVTLLVATLAILLAVSIALPRGAAKSAVRAEAPLKTLLTNRPFVLFLLATAMIHAGIDMVGICHDSMTGDSLDVGNEANTTGVFFQSRVIQTIFLRKSDSAVDSLVIHVLDSFI